MLVNCLFSRSCYYFDFETREIKVSRNPNTDAPQPADPAVPPEPLPPTQPHDPVQPDPSRPEPVPLPPDSDPIAPVREPGRRSLRAIRVRQNPRGCFNFPLSKPIGA
jgi:hypothetical protein